MIKIGGDFMISDTFYQNVNKDLFLKWIMMNNPTYIKDGISCCITKQDEYVTVITFRTELLCGTISIWAQNIIEEKITDRNNNEIFYLHHIITSLTVCCQLFHEFYQSFLKYNHPSHIKVALCCTGGLSTSIFVEQMKEICELEKIDIQLDSLSYNEIPTKYPHYQALYLAPQIAYKEPQIIQDTKHSIDIYCIDTLDFATKNYHEIIKTIQSHLH